MNESMIEYLHDIDAGLPIQERVEIAERWATFLAPEPIKEMVLCNMANGETGELTFTSAWFVTEKHLLEAKTFLFTEHVDIVRVEGNVFWVDTVFNNVPVDESSSWSEAGILINLTFDNGLPGNLSATGSNAKYLLNFMKNHLIPNIR